MVSDIKNESKQINRKLLIQITALVHLCIQTYLSSARCTTKTKVYTPCCNDDLADAPRSMHFNLKASANILFIKTTL